MNARNDWVFSFYVLGWLFWISSLKHTVGVIGQYFFTSTALWNRQLSVVWPWTFASRQFVVQWLASLNEALKPTTPLRRFARGGSHELREPLLKLYMSPGASLEVKCVQLLCGLDVPLNIALHRSCSSHLFMHIGSHPLIPYQLQPMKIFFYEEAGWPIFKKFHKIPLPTPVQTIGIDPTEPNLTLPDLNR